MPQEPVIWLGELTAISESSFEMIGIYEDWARIFDAFDDNMKVYDMFGDEIDYDDLEVGDILEVWTYVDGEDDVVFAIFQAQRPPDPGDYVSICGIILELGEDSPWITVGFDERGGESFTFTVTSDTIITNEFGELMEYEDLSVGMLVCVNGHYDEDDGTRVLYADDILVMSHEPPPPDREWSIFGDITVIDDSAMSITIGGDDPGRGSFTFFVNEDTFVVDCYGNEIGFSDLEVGDTIQAWGVLNDDDVHIAYHVQLDCGNSFFEGFVMVKGEDHFIVGSDENSDDWIKLYVNDDTVFFDMMTGEEVEFDFLELNDMVWGWFIRDEDEGVNIAGEVFIHNFEPPPSHRWDVHGEITGIDSSGIVTLDLDNGDEFSFSVNDGTVYRDCYKDLIEFEDLTVSDVVWAGGFWNSDDVAEAHNVMLDCGQVDFWGIITEIGEDWFKLGGEPGREPMTLTVTDRSEFFDMFGQPIDFEDLEVDQFASGFYVPGEDGALLAGDVYVESQNTPPPHITVIGIIDELGEWELTVISYDGDAYSFTVGEDTLILDEEGMPIDFDDLETGDEVMAAGIATDDPEYYHAELIMLSPDGPLR